MRAEDGRYIVVSGGGTGMGRAIAHAFAGNGDWVVILGRREAVLAETAQQLNDAVGEERVSWRRADLSSPSEVEGVAAAIDRLVDGVINCAGGVTRGMAEDTLEGVAALWEADFRSNVLTAVLLTTALLPRLLRPGGRIVTIASIAALRAGGGSYGAAKGALIPWTYSLAAELGPEGITANVVAPGFVEDTEFFGSSMTPERRERLIGQTLVGRSGRPEDVAQAVLYLASPQAGYVTGQVLQINGGALFGR